MSITDVSLPWCLFTAALTGDGTHGGSVALEPLCGVSSSESSFTATSAQPQRSSLEKLNAARGIWSNLKKLLKSGYH